MFHSGSQVQSTHKRHSASMVAEAMMATIARGLHSVTWRRAGSSSRLLSLASSIAHRTRFMPNRLPQRTTGPQRSGPALVETLLVKALA